MPCLTINNCFFLKSQLMMYFMMMVIMNLVTNNWCHMEEGRGHERCSCQQENMQCQGEYRMCCAFSFYQFTQQSSSFDKVILEFQVYLVEVCPTECLFRKIKTLSHKPVKLNVKVPSDTDQCVCCSCGAPYIVFCIMVT